MVTITTALTTVIWYGTGIQLSAAPWKNNSLIVRLVSGAGYISFDPLGQFNSLTSVTTGQVLIVESLAASYAGTGYQLDNGTAPVTPVNPVRLIASFPAGGTSTAPITLTVAADQPGLYNLDPGNAMAGVATPIYTKNGVAGPLPVQLLATDTFTITGTTVTGTPGILTLLKQ